MPFHNIIHGKFRLSADYPQEIKLRAWISPRICEKTLNYFLTFSWGLLGVDSWEKRDQKISCYSPFNLWKICIIKGCCISTAYLHKFAVQYCKVRGLLETLAIIAIFILILFALLQQGLIKHAHESRVAVEQLTAPCLICNVGSVKVINTVMQRCSGNQDVFPYDAICTFRKAFPLFCALECLNMLLLSVDTCWMIRY